MENSDSTATQQINIENLHDPLTREEAQTLLKLSRKLILSAYGETIPTINAEKVKSKGTEMDVDGMTALVIDDETDQQET